MKLSAERAYTVRAGESRSVLSSDTAIAAGKMGATRTKVSFTAGQTATAVGLASR